MSNKLLIQKCHLPEVLDISSSKVDLLLNCGELPKPVGKLGRRYVWSVKDIELWIELGMPSRREFEDRKEIQIKHSKIKTFLCQGCPWYESRDKTK